MYFMGLWLKLLLLYVVELDEVLGKLLSAKILSATWDSTCLHSACSRPKLELSLNDFVIYSTTHSATWVIESKRHSEQFDGRVWTTYLNEAEMGNMSLNAKITGTDPTYKFPRICDETPFVLLPAGNNERTVQLEGTCFNLTLSLNWPCCRKCCEATSRNGSDCTISQQEPSVFMATAGFGSGLPFWVPIGLGGLVVVLLCICLLLLTLYVSLRRRDSAVLTTSVTSHHNRHVVNGSQRGICRSSSDESKYDVPWDQKFRPLPDYVRELANGSPGVGYARGDVGESHE